MWFKVDDTFADHPKALAAGNASIGLWVRAGAWSARHLTAGHIPRALLAALGGTTAQANALVKAGLWAAEPDGWRFHDWSLYQPTGEAVHATKVARATGAQRTNHQRWHVMRNLVDPDCPFCSTDRSSDQ